MCYNFFYIYTCKNSSQASRKQLINVIKSHKDIDKTSLKVNFMPWTQYEKKTKTNRKAQRPPIRFLLELSGAVMTKYSILSKGNTE